MAAITWEQYHLSKKIAFQGFLALTDRFLEQAEEQLGDCEVQILFEDRQGAVINPQPAITAQYNTEANRSQFFGEVTQLENVTPTMWDRADIVEVAVIPKTLQASWGHIAFKGLRVDIFDLEKKQTVPVYSALPSKAVFTVDNTPSRFTGSDLLMVNGRRTTLPEDKAKERVKYFNPESIIRKRLALS